MGARILAVVAAVAMVVGAVVLRGRLDDRRERAGTTLRLACSPDLEAVCAALEAQKASGVAATVQPDAETADLLTDLAPGAPAPFAGWLTTTPWPAIVDEARERAAKASVLTPGPVLARSPVVLAVRADRGTVLAGHCGAEPGWRCLGEAAGRPWAELTGDERGWGLVRPGLPSVTTAAGLTVRGSAVVSYFDGTVAPPDLSSDELLDPGFGAWLGRLESGGRSGALSPFDTLLVRPAFDAVGALEAEAGPGAATAVRVKPALFYPSPVVTADVVLATAAGREGALLARLRAGDGVRRALADAGWRVEGRAPAPGVRGDLELPDTANLPEPGVLEALRRKVSLIR